MNEKTASRPVVDFLIVGAQKAGTTAAAFNLAKHPDLFVFQGTTSFGQREIEFFNQHWDQRVEWYKTNFDYRKRLVGEKTAELLHRTVTHRRMHQTAPGAKLIVFLRCPVARAFSQWKMATRPGWGEHRSFGEVVLSEAASLDDENTCRAVYECRNKGIQPWREGYLLKGFYAAQLSNLLKWYRREQVYVAVAERVRRDMAGEYGKIVKYLGVEPFQAYFEERFVANPAPEMDANIRAWLIELYRPHNQKLFDLLGHRVEEWAT